jgi:glycosyltransferase involved in cell wall biosynthesis
MGELPGVTASLSLAVDAELLRSAGAPLCALPIRTYRSVAGLLARAAGAPFRVGALAAELRRLGIDLAVCAMPAPLDLMMMVAARRAGVRVVVVIHDADSHPGDGYPMQILLQRALIRYADGVVALSGHVGDRLRAQRLAGVADKPPLHVTALPPILFDIMPTTPPAGDRHSFRLLLFGRLLPYKGLDLLAAAWRIFGVEPPATLRIVGEGPESPALTRLRALPSVVVENRWVPEDEVGALLASADGLVLPYTEASQSGVAAAAIAARRRVVATRVGGVTRQLADEPLALLCDPTPDALAAAIRDLIRLGAAPPDMVGSDPREAWRTAANDLLRWVETWSGSPSGRQREAEQPVAPEQKHARSGGEQPVDGGMAHVEAAGVGAERGQHYPP